MTDDLVTLIFIVCAGVGAITIFALLLGPLRHPLRGPRSRRWRR